MESHAVEGGLQINPCPPLRVRRLNRLHDADVGKAFDARDHRRCAVQNRASVPVHLSRLLIAFVIAVPIAYAGIQAWLSDFAYRVDPGMGLLVIAGGLAFVIALGTAGVQALRAARLDPTTALQRN